MQCGCEDAADATWTDHKRFCTHRNLDFTICRPPSPACGGSCPTWPVLAWLVLACPGLSWPVNRIAYIAYRVPCRYNQPNIPIRCNLTVFLTGTERVGKERFYTHGGSTLPQAGPGTQIASLLPVHNRQRSKHSKRFDGTNWSMEF